MSNQHSRRKLNNHHEKKSLPDLPNDLETEILSRVPANSLAKFKTTCKRWYSLFKDPEFVEMNLEKASAKEVKILLMRYGVYSISVDRHDPISMEFTSKLSYLKDSKDLKITQIFHCNGLILYSTNEGSLVVWNPCTGETISVEPRNRYEEFDKYAFGYGESKSAYKILRFYYSLFEMYDLSSGSWKLLDDYTHKYWIISSKGVSLKGDTYWIAMDKEENIHKLLSFDFTTESFVSIPLPYQSLGHNADTITPSVVRQERIALWHRKYYHFGLSPKLTIWLTNKIDKAKEVVSWSIFFVVDLDKFGLSRFDRKETFLVDEENKVVVCCGENENYSSCVYIVGEDLHKEVHRESTEGTRFDRPCLLSYVPSLVRIPQTEEDLHKEF